MMSQDSVTYASAGPEIEFASEHDEYTFEENVDDGPSLLGKLGAEIFGTFVLVLFGVGVAIFAGVGGVGGGVVAVALAFAIAIAGAAAAVGHISGGHFNPAVTLGAAIAGRTSWKDVLPYWLAQLIGGAAASAVLFVTVSGLPALGENTRAFFSSGANGYGEHSPIAAAGAAGGFDLGAALIIEAVATAVFVAVILGVTHSRAKNPIAPLTIGLTLGAVLLITIPVTNGSVNPARSFAAALFSESWALGQLWVFWVAPLLGAAIAALIYRLVAVNPADAPEVQVYVPIVEDTEVVALTPEVFAADGGSDSGSGDASDDGDSNAAAAPLTSDPAED